MQHQMKVSTEPFEKIARKEKVIESRLYDEKRQQIKVGHEIIFSENEHPENQVKTRVVGVSIYGSFENLFADNEPALFGGENREFLLNEIRQFFSVEDEQKNGVVGFRIEVLD